MNFSVHMTRCGLASLVRKCGNSTVASKGVIKRQFIRTYSDWYRKMPAQSQFTADIEGEPYKTTVTIDNLTESYLCVDSYSIYGFKLNNGYRIIGPCALFPTTALSWNVAGPEDIHIDSLCLFTSLEPKLDMIIVGVGSPSQLKLVDKQIYKDLRDKGIGLELLTTHQACATFNFLNGEGRCIAAALLPPLKLPTRNQDLYHIGEFMDTMMEEKSDYYISGNTGKKIYFDDKVEEKKEISSGEMPQRYADSPPLTPKLPERRKEKPELPEGDKKT